MNITEKSSENGLFVRQPLSPVGKAAFWTLFVITILGVLGIIALSFINGLSIDSIGTTICAFVSLLLILSGIRWLQALTIPLMLIFFYVYFNTSYVLASLMDPKSTQIAGGYGKFFGIAVIGTIALVALISCIAVAVQNYGQKTRVTPRWFTLFLGAALGILLGAVLLGAVIHPAGGATGTTVTNGVPTVHMSEASFDQTAVTIPKGSSLLLVDDTAVMHILSNGSWQNNAPVPAKEAGAPTISNVQVNNNSVTVGPFTTAGTYHIYCTIHAGMQLTVTVQ